MSTKLLLAGLMVAVLAMCADSPRDEERPTIDLEIEGRCVSTPVPSIAFTAKALEPQTINEADLPWGSYYSVRFTSSSRDSEGYAVCGGAFGVVGMTPDTITLAKGEVLSGRVPLGQSCRNVAEAMSRGPVTVEWLYTPPIGRIAGDPIHGRVTFPCGSGAAEQDVAADGAQS